MQCTARCAYLIITADLLRPVYTCEAKREIRIRIISNMLHYLLSKKLNLFQINYSIHLFVFLINRNTALVHATDTISPIEALKLEFFSKN
ncbi:hypothetical protein BpHYR1_018505 [Brachionus plicatilis]|uniref:Uncharacterized protein n=1 Tax=Brachionus plicatilis TaxID=10195 RepID=A0A3M7R001_BRAPC|nr:hypothetical protein BpHYR1_018505 [Brachionus plicatilis]